MDWATLNQTVLGILSELAVDPVTDAPAFRAVWKDRPQEAISPIYQAQLLCKMTRVDAFCEDEQRFGFDPIAIDPASGLPGLLTSSLDGMRDITLQLQAMTLETSDSFWCMSVLERIRIGIYRQRYIDRMRDVANAAFYDYGHAIDVSAPIDGRMRSIGTMDLFIAAAFTDLDTVGSYGWIEKVDLTSQITPQLGINKVRIPP